MIEKHKIVLPQNLSKDWTEEQITAMATVSYNLPFMWNHAFGIIIKKLQPWIILKIYLEDFKNFPADLANLAELNN